MLGMLGKSYGKAGLPEPYTLRSFLASENIISAFSTFKEANTAKSCLQCLRGFVEWLKSRKILSDEYFLPEINYHKVNSLFSVDRARNFNPFRHIRTRIMQLICLLAAELKLTPTPLVGLKTSYFDLERRKLTGVGDEPRDLPDSIVSFLKSNPALLREDGYLLSLDSGKMSTKTLTRQFKKSLDPKYKGAITLQKIASAGIKYMPGKTDIGSEKIKPVIKEPVQEDLFKLSGTPSGVLEVQAA